MELINYRLADFEGPLDMLLVLISKNKMSIADVEIVTIINQYLEIVENSEDRDLDSAGEFIDMAARLIYLKSVYLLPKDDEGEKLKAELQGVLIEYSQAKQAASRLRARFVGDRIITRPALDIPVDMTYNIVHSTGVLTRAYSRLNDRNLRRRPPEVERFEPIVNAPVVSVNSRIFSLLRGLMRNTFSSIFAVFKGTKTRSEAVATFLAILELVRARRIRLSDDGEMNIIRGENK
ncbi:MAG: segregation/condensation protein A [Oscillospiraceae bacterium]|nr:segregation/condensation protein A [Oscillospiraceae bacterium]